MSKLDSDLDETSILERFDRSSPDSLLKSIAREFVRLNQSHALLSARIHAMEGLQGFSDAMMREETPPPEKSAPTLVAVDAAASFLGATGFHPLEYDIGGSPYRWTGPERQFSFQFSIDRRQPADFSLTFDRLYCNVPARALECLVDGEPTALSVSAQAAGFVAQGVLPARSQTGHSVLTFLCPKMGSPESEGQADDRMLGLCFRLLTVRTRTAAKQPKPGVLMAEAR